MKCQHGDRRDRDTFSPNEGFPPGLRDSHSRGISKAQNFFLMSEGFVFHIKYPNSYILHWIDELPNYLAWRTNGDHTWENHRTIESKEPAL